MTEEKKIIEGKNVELEKNNKEMKKELEDIATYLIEELG